MRPGNTGGGDGASGDEERRCETEYTRGEFRAGLGIEVDKRKMMTKRMYEAKGEEKHNGTREYGREDSGLVNNGEDGE